MTLCVVTLRVNLFNAVKFLNQFDIEEESKSKIIFPFLPQK